MHGISQKKTKGHRGWVSPAGGVRPWEPGQSLGPREELGSVSELQGLGPRRHSLGVAPSSPRELPQQRAPAHAHNWHLERGQIGAGAAAGGDGFL